MKPIFWQHKLHRLSLRLHPLSVIFPITKTTAAPCFSNREMPLPSGLKFACYLFNTVSIDNTCTFCPKLCVLCGMNSSVNSSPFYSILTRNFPFNPTYKQDIFFQMVSEFITSTNNDEI